MKKLIQCCVQLTVGVALFGLVAAAGMAQKGDTEQSPGLHRWTLVNACSESIRIAILSDGTIRGWDHLAPGASTTYINRDTTVGIHVIVGNQDSWWSPGGHRYVEMPVNMSGSFAYSIGTVTTGMTPRVFILKDILVQGARTVICER